MPKETERTQSDCYDTSMMASRRAPLGKVWPNLVFVHDSGENCVEFRMQCEVLLPTDAARDLEEVFLPGGNSTMSWDEAVELLIFHVHPRADPHFKQILRNAVRPQPQQSVK